MAPARCSTGRRPPVATCSRPVSPAAWWPARPPSRASGAEAQASPDGADTEVRGTTIVEPRIRAPDARQENPEMSARPTVLLCDDSRALRMLTAQQIDACGYDLAGEADNGAKAVEQYLALKPNVVLLDLVMPKVDGKAALKRLLELDPSAKVIVLSSLGAQNDIEQCLKMGAKIYLQKPIDRDTLARVLAEVTA